MTRIGRLGEVARDTRALADDHVTSARVHNLLNLGILMTGDNDEAGGIRAEPLVLADRQLYLLRTRKPVALADEL